MKTPIADAAYIEAAKLNPSSAIMKLVITARKLELDRAALMEAMERIHQISDMGSYEESIAWESLAAARTNFPES